MRDQVFTILQAIGRSFMLPVAILPIAGLLLGIGASFTNATTIQTYGLENILGNGTILHSLLTIMSDAGNIIFGNLPIIFAVGVAIGMAKQEKEVAALSAMIAFLVMHASTSSVLKLTGKGPRRQHRLPGRPRRYHCQHQRHHVPSGRRFRRHHRRYRRRLPAQPLS